MVWDIFADEFYDRLASSPRLPTTAQPSMADFRTVYEELTGQGHSILSIHITGKLSGTFNSAEQAKASLGDVADIRVVDSRLASVPPRSQRSNRGPDGRRRQVYG